MLESITLLLVCQLAGEVARRLTGLPVPGPVIGMALLFFYLTARGGVPDAMASTARTLLDHLSLLFVPAGVGIVLYLSLVRSQWLAISAALIVSTLLAVAVTALVMQWLERAAGRGPAQPPRQGE